MYIDLIVKLIRMIEGKIGMDWLGTFVIVLCALFVFMVFRLWGKKKNPQ